MCECEFCTYHKHVEHVRETGTIEELRALVDELYERYTMTDFDLDVWEAIGEGKWPSARRTAIGILENADAYEESTRNKEIWKKIHRQTHHVVISSESTSVEEPV